MEFLVAAQISHFNSQKVFKSARDVVTFSNILSPGQDMVLVMSRSISQGAKAGIVTAAGVSIGLIGHTMLAAMGLGAILQTSELAFTAMKYVGAAYLVYLGIKVLVSSPIELRKPIGASPNLRTPFVQGAVSNLSNPKVAIFYFAYLPQFVQPENGSVVIQLTVLGIIFVLLGLLSTIVIAVSAGGLGNFLRRNRSILRWQSKIVGSSYCTLGARLGVAVQSVQKVPVSRVNKINDLACV